MRIQWNEARLARASVFLWIALLCLFGWVSDLGETQQPVIFVALLAVHVGLHWIMLYRAIPQRWHLAYFAVQSVLVVGIGLSQSYITLVLGLFAILAGQAAAYGFTTRQLGVLIGVYVGLMAIVAAATVDLELALFAPLWATTFFLMIVAVVTLYQRQVQARDHAEAVVAELQQAHEQLRAYAERVEDLTLMAERQRIARELHDTLAQGLAGLILQLEAAQAHLINGQPTRAQAIVQHAMARARTSLANSRRTIDNLRSDPAGDDDLGAAIRDEVARFTAATTLPCHLDLGDLPPLSDPIQEHVLRTISECLTNVARHARAREVWVRVVRENDDLILEVCDDGIGFDPAAIRQQPGHYGLMGLHERAQITGGALRITSAPGTGTAVRLKIPLAGGVLV
jgi:two-component system, NarL family, sensor histidine kinase YdfH